MAPISTRHKKIIAVVGVCCAIFIGVVAYGFIRLVSALEQKPGFYACEYTARALILYVDENNGQWPSNWDNLEPYFPDGLVSFDETKQLTRVDWNAKVSDLAKAESAEQNPPFPVVWLKGDDRTVRDEHANRYIWNYLRRRDWKTDQEQKEGGL